MYLEYVHEIPQLFKNISLSANKVAKSGIDLAENKHCDLQEESKNIVVHSAASDDNTNNLNFKRPDFEYVNTHKKTLPEVHFMYLGNKEI
jgi:hypothetical protein